MKNLPQFKNSIKTLNIFFDLGCRGYSLIVPHTFQSSQKHIDLKKIQRILVIQLYALGDVLLSLPLLKGLRSAYPNGEIDFWIGKNWLELGPCLPYITRIIAADSGSIIKTLSTIRTLHKRHYDMAFVLYPVILGSWLAHLVRARFRIGYTRDFDNRESLQGVGYPLLTHPMRLGTTIIHDTQRYLALAHRIGLSITWNPPFIYPPSSTDPFIQDFFQHQGLKGSKPLIGINPNASWEGRRWPTSKFAQLADRLIHEMNSEILFFGSKAEKNYVEGIISLMENKPLWPGPTSLVEMAALIPHCRLFISNDSGPMHMASALNVPTLAIMGLTKVGMFHPWSDYSRTIQTSLPCSPCKQEKANQCQHFSCIRSISVDSVYTAVREMFFCKEKRTQG